MIRVERMYSGEDGFSHFETREFFTNPIDFGIGIEFDHIQGMMLRQPPLGSILDFHCAPRRQFVFQIRGSMRLDCGNGEVKVISAGEILFGDDLTGKGHHSTELDGPRLQLLTYLPDDIDIDAISKVVG